MNTIKSLKWAEADGSIVFYGKLSNGHYFMTDTDECFSECDASTDSFLNKLWEQGNYEGSWEWQEEHVLKRYYPSREIVEEMRMLIKEKTAAVRRLIKEMKDRAEENVLVFWEKGDY